MIVLQISQVKRNKLERPKECPHCQGETFQRWGKQTRRVMSIELVFFLTLDFLDDPRCQMRMQNSLAKSRLITASAS